MSGWRGKGNLLPGVERKTWSSKSGGGSSHTFCDALPPVPARFERTDWALTTQGANCDSAGWSYATTFAGPRL